MSPSGYHLTGEDVGVASTQIFPRLQGGETPMVVGRKILTFDFSSLQWRLMLGCTVKKANFGTFGHI
jgi:hypothetical protein